MSGIQVHLLDPSASGFLLELSEIIALESSPEGFSHLGKGRFFEYLPILAEPFLEIYSMVSSGQLD